MFQVTQHDGRRFSAADAFLRPALDRPNLEVRTQRHRAGRRARGRRAPSACGSRTGGGGSEVLRAEREVLLSAPARSARRSCCCCRASAIPTELRAAGVRRPPRAARASGATSRTTRSSRSSGRSRTPTRCMAAEKPRSLAEWLLRRSGPLTSTVAEVVAFMRTRGGLPAADIQFHMGAAYYEDHGAETYDGHCHGDRARCSSRPRRAGRCGCAPQTRPPSRGSSPTPCLSPRTWPRWSPGSAGARDRRAARRCARSSPRSSSPAPTSADDADLEADLRRRLMLIYHPVGTCADERHRARGGRRLPAARPRPRGPARDRRVDHADRSPAGTPTRRRS